MNRLIPQSKNAWKKIKECNVESDYGMGIGRMIRDGLSEALTLRTMRQRRRDWEYLGKRYFQQSLEAKLSVASQASERFFVGLRTVRE